jgi:lipopolysaccharide transport system permease protein
LIVKTDYLIIEPGALSRHFWKDVWNYRELFFVLAWRDVSVRYKQTAIGLLWAIVRPFLTMVVFTVIFGRLAGLPSEAGVPYALLVFAALLPWNLFSTAFSEAGNSLIGNSNLISKVYFPRMIVPAVAVVTSLVDFIISLAILFGLMVWYQFIPSWQILLLPLFIVMTALAAFGPGLYFSSMTAKYRDFRLVMPFAIQLGMYVSPVGFSSSIVPEQWRLLYNLNPLVGMIDGVRWCILRGETAVDWYGVLVSVAVIMLMLWFGARQFRRTEKNFVDVI